MTTKVIIRYASLEGLEDDDFSYNRFSIYQSRETGFCEFEEINGGTDKKVINMSKIVYLYFYNKEI